jgi:protein-S-isoprenylcysteine O-methyltransferase Ste14
VSVQTVRSPWWYRQRALCIAVLYFCSFYAAYDLARLTGRPAIPLYSFFGERFEQPMLFVALALAAIGWLLRSWGTSYLRVEVVWNYDALADKLVIAGPFRFTRNPLYLGNLFQAAAFATFAPPAGWWLIVFVQWLFLTALMLVEERDLRARYGDAFDAYRAAVPQLLPRPVPVAGEPAPHEPLVRALFSETLSLGFTLAMLAYALFGSRAWLAAWILAGGGAIFQYVVRWRDAR